jgi:hypothetical protein
MRKRAIAALSANDQQIAGSHYKDKAIQPWDYIVGNRLGYLEGNVVKYVSRWRDKGGIDDLRKARHYLDKLIEVETEAIDAMLATALEREATRQAAGEIGELIPGSVR